eukprot:TRINITY_DN27172_c0_g1_i1.p1 TRINITY_DN27172_c0_g1~~TRINITY_DN27172_c0_g1_i1.p1  ORF type:complete len:117 (-),score=27.54 TRINITY_DN27172_c0_g1_i1:11-361(-)
MKRLSKVLGKGGHMKAPVPLVIHATGGSLDPTEVKKQREKEVENRSKGGSYGFREEDIAATQAVWKKKGDHWGAIDTADYEKGLDADEKEREKEEKEIGRAVQQECRDRSRMPSSA